MITYDWRGMPLPDRSAAWGEEIARLRHQRDLLAAALEAIIAEPWLSGGLDACTIASAALYPDAPHQ